MSRRGDNIHKRKDGRWEGRYISSREKNGKAHYSSVYGKTYSEVKNKLNQTSVKITPDSREEVTINEIAFKWLNNEVKPYKKYSTFVKYEYIYIKHIQPHIGNKTCNAICIEDCTTLIEYEYLNNDKGCLSKSLISSIKNVLNQILVSGKISISITAKDIKALGQNEYKQTQLKTFTKDEQERIIKHLVCDMDNYKLGILICMLTGLRLGEICALKNSDINLTKRTLSVCRTAQRIKTSSEVHKTELITGKPKTISSMRVIPICDMLFEFLSNRKNTSIYVVNGNDIMEPRTYQYYFERMQKSLTIHPANFHTLRHTFATNCIENGMDAKCLSEILGHANVQITLNKYVHPSYEQKLKQINAFAINYGQINGQNS